MLILADKNKVELKLKLKNPPAFTRERMLKSPSISLPRFTVDERDEREVIEGVRDRMWEREQAKTMAVVRRKKSILETTMGMRAKLVNWLIEVCLHFHLTPVTLHLTIAYLDGFLQVETVKKEQLQLLGVACLLVAAKLEEIYPPNLRDLSALCAGSCSCADIAEMELRLLGALKWNLTPVTPLHWLNCYLALMPSNRVLWEALRDECHDLLHLTLHYTHQYPPSLMAASCLAMRVNNVPCAQMLSGYNWQQLTECIDWLWSLPAVYIPYEAVRRGERSSLDFNLILSDILNPRYH